MRDVVSYMNSSPAERLFNGLAQDRAEVRLWRDRFRQRHPDLLRRDPGHPESAGSNVLTRAPGLRDGVR